jgi:hypothetical protein
VFVRRVNAFQNVRNQEKDKFHDGVAVVPITRVDRFAQIRIKGVRGRIHYMGTGWTKNNLDSYASGADSGFVSAQNIVGPTLVVGDIAAPGDWTGANFRRRDGRWTHFDWKDDAKNYIRGDTQIDGNVSVPTENAITIRDQFHGMKYKGDLDGPFVHGWNGGALGSKRPDDQGGEKNAIRWDRDGNITIPGNQLCIGSRWCIRDENGVLVFRDNSGGGLSAGKDNRYAMFPEKGNTKNL